MNQTAIKYELDEMCNLQGVRACALVDSSSGLVVEAAGDGAANSLIWESAVNYWRTHFRIESHFDQMDNLGPIGAIAAYHARGTLAMVPLVAMVDFVVICLGDNTGVDWREWQRRVRQLDKMMSDT